MNPAVYSGKQPKRVPLTRKHRRRVERWRRRMLSESRGERTCKKIARWREERIQSDRIKPDWPGIIAIIAAQVQRCCTSTLAVNSGEVGVEQVITPQDQPSAKIPWPGVRMIDGKRLFALPAVIMKLVKRHKRRIQHGHVRRIPVHYCCVQNSVRL